MTNHYLSLVEGAAVAGLNVQVVQANQKVEGIRAELEEATRKRDALRHSLMMVWRDVLAAHNLDPDIPPESLVLRPSDGAFYRRGEEPPPLRLQAENGGKGPQS